MDINVGQTTINEVPNAADLRRQLHTMKLKDKQAIHFAAQASPGQKFLKSGLFSAILTSAAVFGLLFLTNPVFVQETRDRYELAKPSLKRVGAWSILAGLIVILAPIVAQKFSSAK